MIKKAQNYLIYFSHCLLLILSATAIAEDALMYPQAGIMSDIENNHIKAMGKLGLYPAGAATGGWRAAENTWGSYCKKYHENITVGEIRQLLIFELDDLKSLNTEDKATYGPESVYFKSCNYLDYDSIIEVVLDWTEGEWRWIEHELVDWDESDAYVDTKHTLLLVSFLGAQSDLPMDERRVEALVIKKETQLISSRQ